MASLVTAPQGTPEWFEQTDREANRSAVGGDYWWAAVMRASQGLPPVSGPEGLAWLQGQGGYDWTGGAGTGGTGGTGTGGTGGTGGGGGGTGGGGGGGGGTGGTTNPSPQSPSPNPQAVTVPGGSGFGGWGGATQTLNGFGIPGYETNPMVGGGSWEGTTWNGAPYSGLQEAVIPNSDTTNPNSPYYRAPNTNADGTALTPGQVDIRAAPPYQTTWYLQTYGAKPPPYINIHEQIGDSLKGIQAAKPGFNWASPAALAQLGGYGLPGGWTSMLGFTPGGSK